jgi:Rieske 2Fe-2S family protein
MSTAATPPLYNGLLGHTQGLPAGWYFDPAHHARELERIWYRQWLYVCRGSEIAARDYRTVEIGDQKLLLVRDDAGVLQGFHNTCRHRGAALCREAAGRLPGGTLICPYHAWVYDLRGQLLRTSSKRLPEGFELRDHALYPVRVREWNGFVFMSLAAEPPDFAAAFDQPLARMDSWGLPGLALGHVFTKLIHCNWKIFWENYNECLHCPTVHPRLSQLVPIFGRALLEERDDPDWASHAEDADPKWKGGLRRGAESWSTDGRATGVRFEGLSEEDRRAGHIYMTGLPSMFIVGHVDYVRVVRLRPLGPEVTELVVEYLFKPETLVSPGFDLANIVEFTNLVMSEDADVCELNQRGLHAAPHRRGVVMPEEYVIKQLHDWLRTQLGAG